MTALEGAISIRYETPTFVPPFSVSYLDSHVMVAPDRLENFGLVTAKGASYVQQLARQERIFRPPVEP